MDRKKTWLGLCGALGMAALLALGNPATAADTNATKRLAANTGDQAKVNYYRKRPVRVRAYRAGGRGGYSYWPQDVVNTYGLSRSRFGTTNSYRDPFTDRQTSSGPFDHGFFFDSGIAPRGGDSPYLR
jgi:hypothetical protein